MQILGKNGIKGLNGLGYALGLSNGGPWLRVVVYPGKGIVVDPTSGHRERVIVYGGRDLNEYRTSITFAPIADALISYAGDFITGISFDGKFLSVSMIRDGIKACGKIYLESGISWANVLVQIEQAVNMARSNYARLVAGLLRLVYMYIRYKMARIVMVVVSLRIPGILRQNMSLLVIA